METIFKLVPKATVGVLTDIGLSPNLLEYIMEKDRNFDPNLSLTIYFKRKKARKIYFIVDIFEIIAPRTRKNGKVFKKSFDRILKYEEKNRYFFGSELEKYYELEGPRWILIGAIRDTRLFEPTALIMTYYEKYDEALFTFIISDKMLPTISYHHALNPMN
jgi:hypothetical protein